MPRYINVDKLINKYEKAIDDDWYKRVAPSSWSEAYDCVIADIDDCPAADVQEVMHGHYDGLHLCSECGRAMPTDSIYDYIADDEIKFCYFCGAKMEKE